MKKLFTSESVTEGHPDKLCDYISDSVLDAYLTKDSKARVACETVAGKGLVLVTGEISSKANVDIEKVVRDTIKKIGYTDENTDISYEKCKVIVNVSKQSDDIALGVDKSYESKEAEELTEKEALSLVEDSARTSEGAGDQGMVFGYATDETDAYLPMPIYLSHKLAYRLAEVRKNGTIPYLRPDGKVQVTVEYENDEPVRVDTIVVSTQHEENIKLDTLKEDIKDKVINSVIDSKLLDENTKYFINPTGRFVIGGPLGDTGLTGRKIIVDTYGGFSRHGGGAFSGKDATKVDRSGSYMARFVAKNIVANGLAKKCEIQISYAIGVAKPVSIFVDTFGTGSVSDEQIIEIINRNFDLTPRGIINTLDLEKPIYTKTTNYGHFGKEGLSWEKIVNLKK
ncbi:MAG: methionine adenosyltransferase [Clostridia bacterium]|nr:methionine adenosyltransferase [Clostridia bacterium]